MLAIPSDPGFCQLSKLSVIAARGVDAKNFLHQQLTQAVTDLDEQTVRLGGLCSPQGRLLATMNYCCYQDEIRLITSADIATSLLKRLSMFVLRAKVQLQCIDDDYATLGLIGSQLELAAVLPDLANHFPKENQSILYREGQLLRLADIANVCRLIWIVPKILLDTLQQQLSQQLQYVDQNVWNLLEVYAGIPSITLLTQDKFVPQMINFEIVGGVNFKKGCYPGQEVVARSQYRGKIKRRLQMAYVHSHALPGTDLFHSADPEQPCGMVVNVASVTSDKYCVLAEVKLAALHHPDGAIYIQQQPAATLEFLPLPYALPE